MTSLGLIKYSFSLPSLSQYLTLYSVETLGLTIEAYTYPDQFGACDGSADIATGVQIGQQTRKTFALAYRTMVGSDDKGTDKGYKIHIIYGCVASPSDKQFSTINDSPEAITFSWEVSTTPVEVTGFKPTATVVIDSTKVPKAKMDLIEAALYGTDSTESKLLMPQDIVDIINPTPTPGPEDPEGEDDEDANQDVQG